MKRIIFGKHMSENLNFIPRNELSWSKIKKYEMPLHEFPNQEVISIFKR